MAAGRITISYSELDSFRMCPLKHQLGYKERWIPPGGGGSDATDKGSAFHAVLEAHYLEIKAAYERCEQWQGIEKPFTMNHMQWTLAKLAAKKAAAKKAAEQGDWAELVWWMYEGYVERWAFEEKTWWVESVEGREELVLPNPTGGRSKFILKTKIDLTVRLLNVAGFPRYIVDHKSGANLPADRELDLDDQFGLYEVVYRLSGRAVLGTIYNAMRTQRNQADFPGFTGKAEPQTLEQRHKRYRMKRSADELKQIAIEAYNAANWAYSPGLEKAMFSSPDPRQCGWKCDFVDPHIAARKIGVHPRVIMSRIGYTQNFERH